MPPECSYCGTTFPRTCACRHVQGYLAGASAAASPVATFKKSPASCWFVFNLTEKGHPKRAHGSYDTAIEEAKRLATQHPGQEFVVLMPAALVATKVEPVTVTPIPPLRFA